MKTQDVPQRSKVLYLREEDLSWRESKLTALTLRLCTPFNRDYAESFSNGCQQWMQGRRIPNQPAKFYF